MNINPFVHGSSKHTDIMKTQGLKQALDKHGFDAAFGGARRDEEKSRAKERVYSFRDEHHRWDPSVMLHLAKKAFAPGVPPFPLMHVDTTWKFKEMDQRLF